MKNKQNFSKIFLVIFSSLAFLSFSFFVSEAEASNPNQYVSLHEPYTRAPDSVEYYSFAIPDSEIGYLPYIRAFVPPGTIAVDLLIIEGGQQMAVAHYKTPPIGEPTSPPAGYFADNNFTLQELTGADQWATESLQGYLDIVRSYSKPPVAVADAGWIYAKVGGGQDSSIYFTSFIAKVDTKTYNQWWDTYIKDAAGWERYVESVETYVDPTTTTPLAGPATGPDCASKTCKGVSCDSQNGSANPWIMGTKTTSCATVTASASPNSITPISETPPSEVTYLTWSATNAKKLEVECFGTGLANIPRQNIQLTSDLWQVDATSSGFYTKPANTPNGYPGWFHVGTSGTERCTFYPTNQSDGLSGTPFTVEIEVKKPTTTPTTPKPAGYVTLHDPYTRAPDNVEYYSFTHSQANYHGYIPYYRVFIPPGTVALDLQHTAMGSLMGLARHEFPPSGLPNSYGDSSYPTLSELEAGEQRATFSDSYDLLQMASDGFTPPLSTGRAGWLYAKVASDGQYSFFDNHFSVRVDTQTYNAWWDQYIKDSAGWERYVESVETYVDPTRNASTPTRSSNTNNSNSTYICQPDNPGCEKTTCKNVKCDDGCNEIQGLVECDGLN